MKRAGLLICIGIVLCSLLTAHTAGALPFAESYLLRAQGAEALYWNPALITPEYQDIILPGMSVAISAGNNSFDLDTYNYISGRYLTDADKVDILNKVDQELKAATNTDAMLLGLTLGRVSFASSVHARGTITISEDYLKLLLYGNEENDYYFSLNENKVEGISYQDVSFGVGNIRIDPIIANLKIPTIVAGFSASALLGYATAETQKYWGSLHTGLDGMNITQEIYVKTGIGGIGKKAMLGLSTSPIPNLSIGMSLDNLFGSILWMGKKDIYHYTIAVDSAYVSELDEDVFYHEQTSEKIDNFTTDIPPELRLGGIFRTPWVNVSADWIQGFGNSQLTSTIGKTSLAAEFTPFPGLSLQSGISLGNRSQSWSISYGLGFKGKNLDGNFGCRTYDSILPGYKSRGLAFSGSLKIHY